MRGVGELLEVEVRVALVLLRLDDDGLVLVRQRPRLRRVLVRLRPPPHRLKTPTAHRIPTKIRSAAAHDNRDQTCHKKMVKYAPTQRSISARTPAAPSGTPDPDGGSQAPADGGAL